MDALKRSIYGTALLLGIAAVAAGLMTKSAEAGHPPIGKFLTVDGMRLHYVDKGLGPALLLIHGNGMMVEDFVTSGLLDKLAQTHRVIAFDRPGFGYSDRSRSVTWTADRQADLLAKGLAKLGVTSATVVGHSIGTQLAVSLALNHPELVKSLVLLSGYYFPDFRLDATLTAPVSLPVLGDLYRYTVAPFVTRLMAHHAVQGMFAPQDVPRRFSDEFPLELMARAGQIGAASGDATQMMSTAAIHAPRYAELKMPMSIVAGTQDGIVDFKKNAVRLHSCIPGSQLVLLPDLGHMVHHSGLGQVSSLIA